MENVQDYGIIPLLVVGPGLHGHDRVRLAVPVPHLHIWLLFNLVEVLMKAVQQERQQLLTVLLLIAGKLWRKPTHRHFESTGDYVGVP